MNTPRENDDCQTLAPLVMALFDGETDELEAQRARAHLLVCQMCARRWLDWNRSRDLLRAVPVPAPPPTLLWRVLMACRLASLSRKRRFHFGDSLGLASVGEKAEKTGAQFAPRDLSAQILARTTRVEAPPSRQPRQRAFPIFALPSLAVPALAIWLFALGSNTLWVAPAPETPIANPAPQVATAPRRAKTVAPPTSFAAPRRVVSPLRKSVSTPLISKPPAPRAATLTPAPRASIQVPQREVEAPQTIERATPRAVVVAFSPAPASPAPASPRPAAAPAARPVTALRVARRLDAPPQLSRPRLAALSTPQSAPRLRVARGKITVRGDGIENAASDALPSRVSLPTVPAPAPPLLLAENFGAYDDEGVEEMRSVVDDFRAALDPDGFQTIDFDAG